MPPPNLNLEIYMNKDVFSVFGAGVRSVWFIGIGGVSMSSLALTSLDRGLRVGGSDRAESAVTERLRNAGCDLRIGHAAENVSGWDCVVYSAAIHDSNPELAAAREAGIPCFVRAEYLGYVMTAYLNRIGVAGMHGKSTTTSMLAHAFLAAGYNPTIENGAELAEIGGAYRSGGSEWFIFEACEYTDSFLSFFPTVSVVLNIDLDHLDYFRNLDHIVDSFSRYIAKSDTAVVNGDDANVRRACKGYCGRLVTFGLGENCEFRAVNLRSAGGFFTFDALRGSEYLASVTPGVPGEHNVMNSLAAIACCTLAGMAPDEIARHIASFTGCKRRFELIPGVNPGGARVYDDYAHHPGEIVVTLRTARAVAGDSHRVITVFQPHTFTRTYELYDDFVNAFGNTDELLLLDIYAARESNRYGVSSEALARDISANGTAAFFMPDMETAADYLRKNAGDGDIILTMGAGDVWKVRNYL